jgi:hypothetical protein
VRKSDALDVITHAVELGLAAGLGPTDIMRTVGAVFWSLTPFASAEDPWPRHRYNGWSDEPRPDPDRVRARADAVLEAASRLEICPAEESR